jgi:uncharacterized protein YbaP (TraB family)
MRSENYTETPPEAKTGQLSWLLDTGTLICAAAAVVLVTVPLGVWWHRSHNPDTTVMAFTAVSDPDLSESLAGPTGSPLLWVMKDADSTVYLFGSVDAQSMQAGEGLSGWMDQRLFGAFDSADTALFEAGRYAEAPHLSRAITGADAALYRRAVSLQMTTRGLDATKASAMGVTDTFTLPADAWRTGDQRSLGYNLTTQAKADPLAYNREIVKPNQRWLPKIEKALDGKGTVFVTVGAAHLIGEDGLVKRLRQRGHAITRLDSVVG